MKRNRKFPRKQYKGGKKGKESKLKNMKIAESLNIKFLKQYFLYSPTLLQQNFSIQLHLSFILKKTSRKI